MGEGRKGRGALHRLIDRAHEADRPVGLCGEAPTTDPDFAAFLVEQGIDSISLAPNSVLEVIATVAEAEGAR